MIAVDLQPKAETVLLDLIRQAPLLHFTKETTSEYFDAIKIRRTMELPKNDTRELKPILSKAAANLNKQLKTFQVKIESSAGWHDKLVATLNESAEWPDALAEAWSYSDQVNEFHLSDAGVGLLEFIRSGELPSDFLLERSISYKMGFYGRERCIEPYLEEVRRKARVDLNWEKKDTKWGERPAYRLWIGPTELPPIKIPTGVNPVFGMRLDHFNKTDVDAGRQIIYDALFELNPVGSHPVYIIAISTLRELERCFPRAGSRKSEALADYFSAIRLDESLARSYDFRDDAPAWTFIVEPKSDWPTSLSAIRAELKTPSLQERFGLGDEAAKLLNWIEQLPEEAKLLGRVTPKVEDANEKWIGLNCPWYDKNMPAYLQLLIDEINDRTDYELRLQPWHDYGSMKSRIILRRKIRGQSASNN